MDGFKQDIRSDGRCNVDYRNAETKLGTIAEAFGSSSVIFGEQKTKIICAIKADI